MAQRVYLIFKIDELNSVQNTKLVDKIHILRLNKKQNGIVLEPWLKFKSNYKDLFTDFVFRHLYVDRG